MSVVIVGGIECMVRPYKDLCRKYRCKAKIHSKMALILKGHKTESGDGMYA